MTRFRRLIGSALIACAPAVAADETHIEGSVFAPDGSPIRGVVIRFIGLDRHREFSVKTNKVGHYGYYGLPGGRYDVKAFAPTGELIGERDGVNITGIPVQFDFTEKQSGK